MNFSSRTVLAIRRAGGAGAAFKSKFAVRIQPKTKTANSGNRRGFLNWCKPEPKPDFECPPEIEAPKPPPQLSSSYPQEALPSEKPCPLPIPPICEDPRVLIIGAGISGLTAAARLIEAGLNNVTILEARGRPGGRIQSTVLGDIVAELGVDTGYPSFDSLAYRLAAEDGYLSSAPQMDPVRTLFAHADGHHIDAAIVHRAYFKYRKAEEDFQRFEKSTERQLYGDFTELLGRQLRLEVQSFPPEHQYAAARIMMGLAASSRMLSSRDSIFIRKDYHGKKIMMFLEADNSETAKGASLNFPGCPSIPLGLRGALAGLLRRIGPDVPQYNKVVTNIRWGILPTGDPQVTVCTEDGDHITADYAIITLPLGVLKEEIATMFCPPLPYDKTEAIQNLDIRHINKIYLEYKEPNWLRMTKPVVLRFPESKSKAKQTHWITGLSRLSEHPGSNYVMSGIVLGEFAAEMEMLNDAEVIESLTQTLRHAADESCIPYPVDMIRSKWLSDRFTSGSTTAHELGGPDLILSLAEPVPGPSSAVTPALFFAGEATFNKPGTMQGAALSGIREAERLLEILARRAELSACKIKAECAASAS